MTNKNLVQYIIQQHNAVKLSNTAPELFVGDILLEMGLSLQHPELNLMQDGQHYTIRPDFMLMHRDGITGMSHRVIIEVQGPYHDTKIQRKKTEWRNSLLTQMGFLVVLVPSELCKNKYRDYLKEQLGQAMLTHEGVKEIIA